MKITLITVGKIKEKFFQDAIAEYSKRLSRYCKLEIIQVARMRRRRTVPARQWRRRSKKKKANGSFPISRTEVLSLLSRSMEICWILRSLRQK